VTQLGLLDYVGRASVVAPPLALTSAPETRVPERGRLLLVDGNNLAHRAWYSAWGKPAVEVFSGGVLRLGRDHRADTTLVVFDGDGPTWRHREYPSYKASRKPKPPGLPDHLLACRGVCRHMRIRTAWIDGVEGDDLIASYVRAASARGLGVTIASNDRDLWQLVSDHPRVEVDTLDHRTDDMHSSDGRKVITPAVVERLGIRPDQVADWKALIGDASDNYPGVPGIGKVTAAKLLARFGDVETLLADVNLVSSDKLRAKLLEHADLARLCKRLATLDSTLDLPTLIPEIRR
jgi:DNA polymerase-1